MNDFTASNGVSILSDRGTISLGCSGEEGDHPFTSAETKALREFFRAEEDERLGWWRWPDNAEYVVYRWSIDYINVLYLHDGTSTEFRRENVAAGRSRSFISDRERVARDWFDAHPVDPRLIAVAARDVLAGDAIERDGEMWTVRANVPRSNRQLNLVIENVRGMILCPEYDGPEAVSVWR